jgi:hypothetical protein
MINDPALGKNKAQRSGMSQTPSNRNVEFRNANVGQFSGPRPSYQRYLVSEQAQDILNKQLRSYNR